MRIPLDGGVVVVVAPGTVVVVVVEVEVVVVAGDEVVGAVVDSGGRDDLAEEPHDAARVAVAIPAANTFPDFRQREASTASTLVPDGSTRQVTLSRREPRLDGDLGRGLLPVRQRSSELAPQSCY